MENSNSSLTSNQLKALGKRKREEAALTTSRQLLLAPPPGSLSQLSLAIEDSSVSIDRIQFGKEFTKKLVTDALGLPSLKTSLSFAIHSYVPPGECPLVEDDAKPAKLKFNSDSSYLKLGSNFIKELNLTPGSTLKMTYLYWQRGGGGKDGSDPIYHFRLEANKPPSLSNVRADTSTQMEIALNYNASTLQDCEERVATSAEKPRQASRITKLASVDALEALANAAHAASFRTSPASSIPPRYPAPKRPNGVRNINSITSHPLISKELADLTPPAAGLHVNVQPYTLTAGFTTQRLKLKHVFLKNLLEKTLGLNFSKDMLLKTRFLLENGAESVFENLTISTKNSYFSRWHVILPKLGGAVYGDELCLTYLGSTTDPSGATVYCFNAKINKNTGDADIEVEYDAMEDAANSKGAVSGDDSESMENLMQALEEWNKKYETASPPSPSPPQKNTELPTAAAAAVAPQPAEEKVEDEKLKNTSRYAAVASPSSPTAPICRSNAPEPLQDRPILSLSETRRLKSTSKSPSLAPNEPQKVFDLNKSDDDDKAKEDRFQQQQQPPLPKKQRKLDSAPRNLPDHRVQTAVLKKKNLSVLQVCADEINALEFFMSQVAAEQNEADAAAATAAIANAQNNMKRIPLVTLHRHRLAKHFVDSGIAKEMNGNFPFVGPANGPRNVFIDLQSELLSIVKYREQSLWCGDFVGSLKAPLVQSLRDHGACISPSLEAVLRGGWPFKVWIGTMNNTALLPAGVGVVALEDIPAGSFVCQFIGKYIYRDELPEISVLMYGAYREEQAELKLQLQLKHGTIDGEGEDHENLNDDYKNDFHHRHRLSELAKSYRTCIAHGTECVVPASAAKTLKQRAVIENSFQPCGSNAAINNEQWRRLSSFTIDAKDSGNATRFMRRSEVNFNLARVQLNVPNGPTKILYYAKRDIAQGEELVREP